MDRDVENSSNENLRQFDASDLLARPDKIFGLPLARPIDNSGPISVEILDIPAARAALAEAGMEIRDLDKLANDLATGRDLRRPSVVSDFLVGPDLMGLGGIFGVFGGASWFVRWWFMRPTADYNFPADLQEGADFLMKVAIIFFALAAVLVAVGIVRWITQFAPAASAVEIVNKHLTSVSMPAAYAEVVAAAVKAEETIVGTEVWSTGLFDSHHVRLGLSAEVDLIASRMRRLTSVTHGTGISEDVQDPREGRLFRKRKSDSPHADDSTAQAMQQIKAATTQRVAALEEYRDQVLACDREYRRLQAAESAEVNASRLTDLLASTGADQAQIEHLKALSREAAAATDALRDVLALMTGTVSTLSIDSSSKS